MLFGLPGCQKTTTTTETPNGTRSTTTISPTPDSQATLERGGDRAAANVDRAVAIARDVDGVKSVKNRLTVKQPG